MSDRTLEGLIENNHRVYGARIQELDMHCGRYRATLVSLRGRFAKDPEVLGILAPSLVQTAGTELLAKIQAVLEADGQRGEVDDPLRKAAEALRAIVSIQRIPDR